MIIFTKSPTLLLGLCAAVFFMGAGVEGVIRFTGKCPNLDAVPNFLNNLFKGEWYETSRYSPIFENVDRCLKYTFSNPFGPYIQLELSGKSSQSFRSTSMAGTATLLGPTGILSVKFPLAFPTPTKYYVIGTDYVSYAVLWNCQNTNDGNVQNAIILTRSPNPSPYTVETALRTTDSKRLSRFLYNPADQSYC